MFIPYRVVQIKKNRQKPQNDQPKKQVISSQQPSLLEKSGQKSKYSKNKGSCFYPSKNQNHQETTPNQIGYSQKIFSKQNPIFHLSLANNPQKNTQGCKSIDLGIPQQLAPTNISKKTKTRPTSCTQSGRKYSQRYSQVSGQNNKRQQQQREQNIKAVRKTECTGWNGIYNIYENQGKQFCFNFSKKIGADCIFTQKRNRSASIYKTKKMSESLQKNVNNFALCGENKPKRNNLFQSYIYQVKRKRAQEKTGQNSSEVKQGIQRVTEKVYIKEEKEIESDQARLINLEKVYKQWKGHFENKKSKQKNISSSQSKKKNIQDMLAQGKIDGWQTPKQKQDLESLQQNENEENILFFAY